MTAADAAAILELFPKCAICGKPIADGEGFRAVEGRNRVCHSSCAGQSA